MANLFRDVKLNVKEENLNENVEVDENEIIEENNSKLDEAKNKKSMKEEDDCDKDDEMDDDDKEDKEDDELDEQSEFDDEEKLVNDENKKHKPTKPAKTEKVVKEDLDMLGESLQAIFGEDVDTLSEEFKSRTETVFKAAVLTAANAKLEELKEGYELQFEERLNEQLQFLEESIDSYLDKVVMEWLENNKVAVQHNIRTELTESFLTGMKALFENHYVDIPEDKFDVVGELTENVRELEESVNLELAKNASLRQENKALKTKLIFEEVASNLTMSEREKLDVLAESIDFTDEDAYKNKLSELYESYFNTNISVKGIEADDEKLELDELNESKSTVLPKTEGEALAHAFSQMFGKK